MHAEFTGGNGSQVEDQVETDHNGNGSAADATNQTAATLARQQREHQRVSYAAAAKGEAAGSVLTAEKRRKSGDGAGAKNTTDSQTAAAGAQQQQEQQEGTQLQQSQAGETETAAAEDAAVTEVAAEILDLRAQLKAAATRESQLRAQLHHERGISQGLLDAQPALAAIRRKQNAAATETETTVPEWAGKCAQLGVKVQVGSKVHRGNTPYTNTDSNKTRMALDWIGVRPDVHKRQQAQVAAHRKQQRLAKIWRYNPVLAAKSRAAAAESEATAAIEAAAATKSAAATEKKTEATSVFCLLAAAADADTVARAAAKAANAAEKAATAAT